MGHFSIFKFVQRKSRLFNCQNEPDFFISFLPHFLYIFNALGFFSRMFTCFYCLRVLHFTEYFARYDRIMGELVNLGIDDGYLFLAFTPLVLFFIYIHWTVHLTGSSENSIQVWSFIYNSLVPAFEAFCEENCDLFQSANNWAFVWKNKRQKQYFMIRFLKFIGFEATRKKRKRQNLIELKNSVRLVTLWLILEAFLLYLVYSSKLPVI